MLMRFVRHSALLDGAEHVNDDLLLPATSQMTTPNNIGYSLLYLTLVPMRSELVVGHSLSFG